MVLLILKYINLVEKNRLWSKFDITISSLHPTIKVKGVLTDIKVRLSDDNWLREETVRPRALEDSERERDLI